MAKIDSAYDYYVSTYGNQKASRYDSHKKSDLRKVYNHIIKSNKDSPLYKISDMDEAKRYAIDIKENAKAIQNAVASLTVQSEAGEVGDAFLKKVAVSSDDSKVAVEYVGDGNEKNSTREFDIQVNRLATPQVNKGNALRPEALSFTPGTYSFDLTTNTASYEFQYNVTEGETNEEVLNKLARLVNGSNLKLSAEITDEDGGRKALKLTSTQTGLRDNESYLFSITPTANPASIQAMNLLGINQITEQSQNSAFLLNGRPEQSLNNTFTINNAFELTLKEVSEPGKPTTISFKADTDAVADNIQTLLDVYNKAITTADKYSDGKAAAQGKRLYSELTGIAKNRLAELESIGLHQDADGQISINKDELAEAITTDRARDTFATLSEFKDAIGNKANSIGINPMNYVDKVVVEYKNPGKNFATPYISSIYSGMMLDNKV